MDVLALGYRPTKFTDVVGQEHVKVILRAMAASGRVPPALVFSGARGTGKTTCLKALIRVMEGARKAYALASPTGRAATRTRHTWDRSSTLAGCALYSERTADRSSLEPCRRRPTQDCPRPCNAVWYGDHSATILRSIRPALAARTDERSLTLRPMLDARRLIHAALLLLVAAGFAGSTFKGEWETSAGGLSGTDSQAAFDLAAYSAARQDALALLSMARTSGRPTWSFRSRAAIDRTTRQG